MLISLDWVKDFVDLSGISPAEIGERLTLSTAEVERIEESRDPARPGVIIEIDNKSVTHRPDLWGHIGIGRELAALLRRQLVDLFDETWSKGIESLLPTTPSALQLIVDPECACQCFSGLVLQQVHVEPSPTWMQQRLRSVGIEPINNLVDIGNYLMIELGFPMHMYDFDQIAGRKLHVGKLKAPAKLLLLNNTEVTLESGDTIISDQAGPVVIAGIMGGVRSGIHPGTKSVFIEVANWKPGAVRRLSSRIGVRTDSSARFEKSLDSFGVRRALLRAVELTLKLCPKATVHRGLASFGPSPSSYVPRILTTSAARISAALGHEMTEPAVVASLTSLGFGVQNQGEQLKVSIPSFRASRDFQYEADLAEEVGRVVGYGKIAPLSPRGTIVPAALPPHLRLQRAARDFLTQAGQSFEIMTYPLVGEALYQRVKWPLDDALTLSNPISIDRSKMRPSLLPSLLEAALENMKHFPRFRCFEIGRSYFPDTTVFSREENHLALAFFNEEKSEIVQLLDVIEGLGRTIEVAWKVCDGDFNSHALLPPGWPGIAPQRFQCLTLESPSDARSEVGCVFDVHPLLLRSLKARGNLTVALINLAPLEVRERKGVTQYRPLARFPEPVFDLTVIAGAQVPAATVVAPLLSEQGSALREVKVRYVYPLQDERKSVTLRCVLTNHDRTLSGAEIKEVEQRIVTKLSEAGFPLKGG